MDCILTGVLDGDEEMIKVMHDEYKTITIYKKGGKCFSWAQNTLVVEALKLLRRAIIDCLRNGFKIPMIRHGGRHLIPFHHRQVEHPQEAGHQALRLEALERRNELHRQDEKCQCAPCFG